MTNKDKIDPQRVDEAAESLKTVAVAIADFEKVWALLTPVEQMIMGGVVFNLVCPWTDLHITGALCTRPIGGYLINSLANFFNNPPEGVVKKADKAFIKDDKGDS